MKKTDACFDIVRVIKESWPPARYVYESGKIFESVPLSNEEVEFLNEVISALGRNVKTKAKECYSNSQIFMLGLSTNGLLDRRDFDIRYCEGYFINKSLPFPIAHGWISMNNKIIDLTLDQDKYLNSIKKLKNKIIGVIPDEFTYLGVEIDTEYILDRMLNDLVAYTVLDDGPKSILYVEKKMEK